MQEKRRAACTPKRRVATPLKGMHQAARPMGRVCLAMSPFPKCRNFRLALCHRVKFRRNEARLLTFRQRKPAFALSTYSRMRESGMIFDFRFAIFDRDPEKTKRNVERNAPGSTRLWRVQFGVPPNCAVRPTCRLQSSQKEASIDCMRIFQDIVGSCLPHKSLRLCASASKWRFPVQFGPSRNPCKSTIVRFARKIIFWQFPGCSFLLYPGFFLS
jgi:hypothetical protein